jgi:hypothetical protein
MAQHKMHKRGNYWLNSLVRMCEDDSLPLLVGGDFNIIRRQEKKNNDNFNARCPFIFNAQLRAGILEK